MGTNIDVVGYLLTAVVFSVGFLSARIHASDDALRSDVNAMSWRIREVLARGERLSPAELAGPVASLARSRDRVAQVARIVNLSAAGATAVVWVDALFILARHVASPRHALLQITVLFLVCLAVVGVGEVDRLRVQFDVEGTLENTTLGEIRTICELLDQHRYPECLAAVAALAESLPQWGLLSELPVYLDLLSGDLQGALLGAKTLRSSLDDQYLTALLGCEAAVALGQYAEALRFIDAALLLVPQPPELDVLRHAVALGAAHLDELFAQPQSLSKGTQQVSRPAASAVVGTLLGGDIGSAKRLSIDVRPRDLQHTRAVLEAFDQWDSRELLDRTAFAELPLEHVLIVVVDDDRALVTNNLESFALSAVAEDDAPELETLGALNLVYGEPRDAIRVLERSLRLMPSISRSHWLLCLAYNAVGWRDRADTSLRRALILEPDDPVLRLTERLMSPLQGAREQDLESQASGVHGLTDWDQIRLAMLGLPNSLLLGGDTCRDRFLTRFAIAATTQVRALERATSGKV